MDMLEGIKRGSNLFLLLYISQVLKTQDLIKATFIIQYSKTRVKRPLSK